MLEFPVFSIAFFTQRTAFLAPTNVKCVWILAPDSSLHAFAVSHASNRPRLGWWLPASKGPLEDGELPPSPVRAVRAQDAIGQCHKGGIGDREVEEVVGPSAGLPATSVLAGVGL